VARISLFLDEDVHFALGSALRKRGFDAIHAQELDQKGISDAEQLACAVEQKRCLLSFNMKDFVILHNVCTKWKGALGDYRFQTTSNRACGEGLAQIVNINSLSTSRYSGSRPECALFSERILLTPSPLASIKNWPVFHRADNNSITATVMALTPAWIVGSGLGANSGECREGNGVPR